MPRSSDRASALSLIPYLHEQVVASRRTFVSWGELEAQPHAPHASRADWRVFLAHAFAMWPRIKQTEQGLEFEYWEVVPDPPVGPLPSWYYVQL